MATGVPFAVYHDDALTYWSLMTRPHRTTPYTLAEAQERLGNVSRQAIYGRESRGTLERLTDGRYAVAAIEKARVERRERLQAELAGLVDD